MILAMIHKPPFGLAPEYATRIYVKYTSKQGGGGGGEGGWGNPHPSPCFDLLDIAHFCVASTLSW